MSLSRNIASERVCELSTNLHKQLIKRGKDFIGYFLVVDESSDTFDTSQLSIFIRAVDSSLCVTEELLGLKSMHGTTTGKEIFEEVYKRTAEIRAKGLNHRQLKCFLEELDSEYRDAAYHSKVRWLSRGKVLNRCFELSEEICQFMENKGKDTTDLKDIKFLCELAFLSDIVSHLDVLNLQLQGRGTSSQTCTQQHAARSFKTKLCLWKTQMLQGNLGHFPCCQIMAEQIFPAVLPSVQFAKKNQRAQRRL